MNPIKFTASTAWRKCMESLTDSARLEVYDAIFKYAEDGITPTEMNDTARVAFDFIRADIDTIAERKRMISEKRSAAASSYWSKNK